MSRSRFKKMSSYCINCFKDLFEQSLDFTRSILCDDCTCRLVLTKGKTMGMQLPSERSRIATERQGRVTVPSGVRKLKPLEEETVL